MKFGTQAMHKSVNAPSTHLYVFLVFLLIVAVTGGGSREDVDSLIVLRPAAALFLGWALFFGAGKRVWLRGPVLGVLALAGWMIIQLIPLPHAFWSGLPGRAIFDQIGQGMGLGDLARPISLAPSETQNALFSLIVPLSALALLGNIDRSHYPKVILGFIVLALISAGLGLAQLAGAPDGPLYTYRITNFGEPVGLFANRNHQAVLLAVTIMLLGWYAGRASQSRSANSYTILLPVFGIPLLFLLNLIGGSRLGLALAVLAFFPALLFMARNHQVAQLIGKKRMQLFRGKTLVGILTAFAVVAFALVLFVSRSEALDRFMVTDASEEMRARLLPIFSDMITQYLPVGSGFGSFEHIYPIFEPIGLIERRYLNQAHNDLAQLIIEGGLPAAVLLLLAIGWFVWRCVMMLRQRRSDRFGAKVGLPSAIALLMFAGASLFDYPLRTPIFMTIMVGFAFLLDRATDGKAPIAR